MKKFVCIIGIIAGIIIAILGFGKSVDDFNSYYYFGDHVNVSESKQTYGGDAYTGIQNAVIESAEASAETANNVNSLAYMLEDSLENINFELDLIIGIAGLSMFLISLYKFTDLSKEKKKNKKATVAINSETSPVTQETDI